ncbi:MAG: STAS domain-containing protein [Planctomycetia bacterium]|nr:STAS domain-containing protein [Planctomycetia bacterium]
MTQKNGDVLVAYFTDAKILDEAKIQQLSEELTEVTDRVEQGKLLLNFNDVKFMSSSVLGRLVHLNKKCKEFKIDLKMCNISPEIMEVFKITKLNKVFDIHSDEPTALTAFHKRGWFG